MRVITYNIRKGKGADGRSQIGMRQLGEALADHAGDLVLCQEVFHADGDPALEPQSPALARALDREAYYGANKFRRVGHHGNATFTRFVVQHMQNHDISTNRIERRGALHLTVEHEGRRVHVFNVHLGLNRWQRGAQISQLARIMRESCNASDPIVLAGDFNDWNFHLDRRLVGELGFHNALADVPDAGPTWPAGRPLLTLDRIYLRNLRASAAGRLSGKPWSELSDHLPLWAELAAV